MSVGSISKPLSHSIPRILLSFSLAGTFACNSNAPCGQDSRTVDSNGAVGTIGNREIAGSISVFQLKNHSDDRYGFAFSTDIYAGHITGVTMYPASDPARVLATFPVTAPASTTFSAGNSASQPATLNATLTELYDLLSANGARIRATTNLAPPKTLDFPLTMSGHTDWTKAAGCYG